MKDKLKKLWDNFEKYMICILLTAMMINIFCQVFIRVVFGKPLYFTEEISRYAFVWAMFLGISFGIKNNLHLRVEVLRRFMGKKGEAITDICLDIVFIILFIKLIANGIVFSKFQAINISPALEIPMNLVTMIVPIAFFLGTIRLIESVILKIRALKSYGPH